MTQDRTAFLGRFDPLVIPILIDVLGEEGIFAATKMPFDQPPRGGYLNVTSTGADEVIVDADRLADARRIVDERLPQIVAEMSAELAAEFPESAE